MPYLLNVIYLAAWLCMAPWLCWQAWIRKKPVRGLGAKWWGVVAHDKLDTTKPVAWFHGVSVGEIHLLRQVVARFRERFPCWQCIVSTTTATGHDEACKHFADLPVIFWPFDFTWAVKSALRTLQPKLVILSEGEMWPNFLWAAKKQGVKVALINGRMSPRSARRFLKFRPLLASLFAQLDWIGAQNDEYASHYRKLGARNVATTGNIKFDGVVGDRHNAMTRSLRELFGIAPDAIVWVAGSTQAPEESLAIDIYRHAVERYPKLQLILVPRHPERFEEVARLLEASSVPFVRRSTLKALPSPPAPLPGGEGRVASPPAPLPGGVERVASPPVPLPGGEGRNAIILVDTIGELGAVWGMADIAFVGGSLDGKRGGQNMIEPSAYGAAVVFGPHTWNFKQTVAELLARDAALQVNDRATLEATVLRLLEYELEREQLGAAARAFVLSQQGATQRTLDELAKLFASEDSSRIAA